MHDIQSPPDPMRRRALISSVASFAGATAVAGTAWSSLAGQPTGAATMIDVRGLGAVGDGIVNDTQAVQRGIDRARIAPGGATLFFPSGRYAIDRLDLRPKGRDDFQHRITLEGEGAGRTTLVPAGIGAVLLDAAGCNNLAIRGLSIDSGHVPSAAAVLLGRTAASPNCNGGCFADLVIEGSYSIAAVVAVAAETTRWRDCRIANGHEAARHCCFVTATDPAAISGLEAAGLIPGPNTDNVMTGCVFYAPHAGARMLRFATGAGYAFFGCSLLAGDAQGARLVVYQSPRDGVFNGPVGWHGCHFEVTAADACVHWIEAPRGESYWRNITIHGGYAVIDHDTPLLDFDRSDPARCVIVQSMVLQAPALPPGVTGANVCGFAFIDCDLSLLTGEYPVVAPGFLRNCRVDARDIRTPLVAGRPIRMSRDRGRRQTFGSGMIVENTDPSQGEVGSWIVPTGGAGTIEANGGNGIGAQAGEVVDVDGKRQVVWRRTPGKRIAPPRLEKIGA